LPCLDSRGKKIQHKFQHKHQQKDKCTQKSRRYKVAGSHTVNHTGDHWNARTPPGFLFSAKVPQVITHEKMLLDCDQDLNHFLKTMEALGNKLGPLLFQFGYFNQMVFKTQADFLALLKPFLKKLPKDHQFALEIRNKHWLDARFADVLRESNVALTLIDQSWVPRPWERKNHFDLVTADFTYVRWLGDRQAIEEQTKSWDKLRVDRSEDLANWVALFRQFVGRNLKTLAYANNHYAGHGPGTIKLFWDLWNKK